MPAAMKTHTLLWKALPHTSTEFTTAIEGKLITVNGHICGFDEGIPFHVHYHLIIDPDWQVQSVSVELETPAETTFRFKRDETGRWWDVKNKRYRELDGCDFVDISLTPFTNTLPIRNLMLKENETREIKVLYFDVPKGEYMPQRQRYTNKGNGVYKYEGLDTDFEAEVEVDGDGFVRKYEGVWERVES